MATLESLDMESNRELTLDTGPVLKTGLLYKQGTVNCW